MIYDSQLMIVIMNSTSIFTTMMLVTSLLQPFVKMTDLCFINTHINIHIIRAAHFKNANHLGWWLCLQIIHSISKRAKDMLFAEMTWTII